MSAANIPDELRARHQWVLWRRENRNGRPTKVPYQVSGERADVGHPASWTSYETVTAALRDQPANYDGIGFVFTAEDPYCGLDLDDCLKADGTVKDWARPILDGLADGYCEISPSGRGVKCWVRAQLAGTGKRARLNGRCELVAGADASDYDGAIEIYDRLRYFAVTGVRFEDCPPLIADHQKDIEALYRVVARRPPAAPSAAPSTDSNKIPQGQRHNTLVSLAGTMRARGMSLEEICAALLAINRGRCQPPYEEAHIRKIARSAARWRPGDPVEDTGADLINFPLTDSGNAERILARFGRDIRFCQDRKKFLVWDGRRWAADGSKRTSYLAKEAARLLYRQARKLPAATEAQLGRRAMLQKHARKWESAKGRKDSLECLSAEPDVQIAEPELDSDPELLNCESGTIELRTGRVRPHRREDLISKLIPSSYDPQSQCPRFLQFLDEIMGAGPDAGEAQCERAGRLVGYLQRAFGCAATGKPEKVVFMFYGKGNNGKTTLIETVRAALGDNEYAGQISIESLMARPKEAASSNAVNSDLADLRGCRFVASSEVDKGQRFAASRVKYLTGLGKVKARRLFENWIEFPPTHKLFLDCNHRPLISDPSDAVWNRVKCIPFDVEITNIDTALGEKLKRELPGILRWIVEGARKYLSEGLGDVPEVAAATEGYREESDRLREFLAEKCIVDLKEKRCYVEVARLWPSYSAWAELNGERYPLDRQSFDERLLRLGCAKGHDPSGTKRVWKGIRFRTESDPQPDSES